MSTNPFVTVRNVAPVFELKGEGEEAAYVCTGAHPMPNQARQQFPARKSAGTFRVFCLGGSAAQGWPHRPEYSFPSFLRRKLERLMPDRRVEVINVCAHAYAAYRVKLICDEIVSYEPDLLVIWSGNNEFHEEKIFDRPWNGANGAAPKQVIDGVKGELTAANLYWAFGRADPHRIESARFEWVRSHYAYNLAKMTEAGHQHGARVVLCGVPVNLGGWRPNASAHAPETVGPVLARWEKAYADGLRALEDGRLDDAVQSLTEATEIDPMYADVWFDLGTALQKKGAHDAAAAAFDQALMLDAFPFRSVFNDVVRQVAAEQGAIYVDLPAAFRAASDDTIPGYNLFIDYVHPTPDGNELAAATVARALLDEGVIARPEVPVEIREDSGYAAMPLPERCRVAAMALNLCGSMRQWKRVRELSEMLRATAPKVREQLGARGTAFMEKIDWVLQAQPVLLDYARLERAQRLGCVEEEFDDEDDAEVALYKYAYHMQARWGSGNNAAGGRHRAISDQELSGFFPRIEHWDQAVPAGGHSTRATAGRDR
jgi:lysophospholipase L1-like esterase